MDRGLFVRERIFVPLWVTTLETLLGWLWRVLVRIVRLIVGYPVASLAVFVETVAWRRGGLLAVTLLDLAVTLVLTGWWWCWPRSYARWVTVPLRSWWRFQRIYKRRWRPLMAGCGLLEAHDHTELMPQILRLRSHATRDDLLISLAPGQIPADVTASAEAMAHGLGAWRVSSQPAGPARVHLLVLWADPLADAIHPGTTPPTAPDRDHPRINGNLTELTAASVLGRLAAVVVGVTEAGPVWTLPLLPGRHLLVSGTTGSGKSGLLWAILWQLRDLIDAGWVTVTALDPKYVELRAVATSGLGTVVTDVTTMPTVLEDLVAELNARCEAMTGRAHVPSPECPVRVVIVDELATLTALSDNKSRGRVEAALGHLLSRGRAAGYLVILTSVEATKEVVRWRGLCSTRVCYRTDDDQADLVLGDGAHDRGAHTELIPETSPGIGYARIEGRAGITRVRTLHITDTHLATLHTTSDVAADLAASPAADRPVGQSAGSTVTTVIDLTGRIRPDITRSTP